jgi:alpha-L-fucosidase 2
MFHGTADEESSASVLEALCKQLPHCLFYPVKGAIHSFENWHPDQWGWKEDLTSWLRDDRRGLWNDIVYDRPDGRELLMDAYIPDSRGPLPAVIIVHGGGWEAGNKVTYVSPVFGPLAQAGFAWFSIDYRLTPYVHIPEQLEDIRAAIRYVRAHADRFHIDPNRIALLGESASGQLVAQVAAAPCIGCEVQAVVSFYGVYDFTQWPEGSGWQRTALRRLFRDWRKEELRRYSPQFNARPGQPPILLIQGTKDELCRGTMEYAQKLKEIGAPYKLILLEGAPHGMENWEGRPEWAFYKQQFVEWLRATLRVQE